MLQSGQAEKYPGTNIGAMRPECLKGITKGKNEPNIESKNSQNDYKTRSPSSTDPEKSFGREDGDKTQMFFKGLLQVVQICR